MNDTTVRSDARAMDDLRRALLGDDLKRLREIEARLADHDRLVLQMSLALPEITAHSDKASSKLSYALRDPVVKSIALASRATPDALGQALAPVMGPAIANAITKSLRDFRVGMETVFTNTLTPKGLGWRFKSWRTGMPVTRIAMRETMSFQAEHVLLASKRSGKVLAHTMAANAAGDTSDTDAKQHIQLVTRLALQPTITKSAAEVQQEKIGDRLLLTAHGPWAVVSAVVWGSVPAGYCEMLRTTLEKIEREFAQELKHSQNAAGDTFSASIPTLETLLAEQFRDARKTAAVKDSGTDTGAWKFVAWLAFFAALIWALYSFIEHRQRNALERALAAQPAAVVTQITGWFNHWTVHGLTDPSAFDASTVLRDAKLKDDQVRYQTKSFISVEPAIILARAKAKLNPPPDVKLTLQGNRLLLGEGTAQPGWIDAAKSIALTVPGIESVDFSKVQTVVIPAPQPDYTAPRDALTKIIIEFSAGSEIAPRQIEKVEAAASHIKALVQTAAARGERIQIAIDGHTDASSSPQINARIANARAEALAAAMVVRGIDAQIINAKAAEPSNGNREGTFGFGVVGK